MTDNVVEHRDGFHSLRRGGLNWETLPLRLFVKGNRKFWNPADIDFSADARDWKALTDEERRSATYLCVQFVAGEEAVTEDIQPFMKAMAAEVPTVPPALAVSPPPTRVRSSLIAR